VDKRLEDHGDFHWPLRIAYGAGEAARQAVEYYYHGDLIENQGVVKARRRYDLLFLTERDLRRLQRGRARVGAGLVIQFVESPTDICLDAAARVTESVSASAVCVTGLPGDMDGFVKELLDHIAHNLPLDVACARAVNAGRCPDDRWVMIGQPAYVESAKVTTAVARMRAEAEDLCSAGLLDAKDFEHVIDVLGPVAQMGDESFMSESGGATEIAGRVGHVRPILATSGPALRGGAPAEPSPSSVRQLQAQVHARMPPGLVQRKRSFEPGAEHTINMRIGRSHLDWMAVETPFPWALLPPNERYHELDIHIVAPGLFAGERCKTILLGQAGESTVAAFDVAVPDHLDVVHMSVSVWRGRTHLQSATLKGPVKVGDEDPGGDGIRFSTGDRNTMDLERKAEPDLAFIQQAGQLWMKILGKRQLIELPDIKSAVDRIRTELFEGAKTADIPGIKLGDEEMLPMLRMLVRQGGFIRRELFGDDPLDNVRSIEVTSSSSGEFFPVEFFYDYPRPRNDATLCTSFGTGSGMGCDACEALSDPGKLCPSGFWLLRKIIQREVRPVGPSPADQSEASDACDRLPETRNIVFAASNQVNTSTDPERVRHTIDALKSLDAMVYPADSWEAWEFEVAAHAPALLLAIPHNVDTESGFSALQIAKDKNLELDAITPRHVCPSREGPGPLLFLLGCNTANPSVGYQDFIRQMRCKGAAVVVGTLTYVLGPQAAPLAKEFVRALWAAGPGSTIGELLPQVRATMLRADNPMALALVAYGDADWKIG
jgi:hypothetical protein